MLLHATKCGAVWGLLGIVLASSAAAQDEFGRRVSWEQPSREAVRKQLDDWLAKQELTDEQQTRIDAIWAPRGAGTAVSDSVTLDRVAESLAVASEAAQAVWEFTSQEQPTPRGFESLRAEDADPFLAANLRLYYARWLAQHDFYDESLEQIAGLEVADVIDPSTLLFYQAVGHHRLLAKEACLPAVEKLLEREATIPRRYAKVATLIAADIRPLKVDSLDEIARLMRDIERRLDKGRAGTKVRKQEDDVVAKLDKMIEELEQQQQQQSSSSSSQGGIQSSAPAQDSAPLGGRGEGKVDDKPIGKDAGWGDLPDKDRQEILQDIAKDLPAHYRDVIEQYFKKLARDRRGDN